MFLQHAQTFGMQALRVILFLLGILELALCIISYVAVTFIYFNVTKCTFLLFWIFVAAQFVLCGICSMIYFKSDLYIENANEAIIRDRTLIEPTYKCCVFNYPFQGCEFEQLCSRTISKYLKKLSFIITINAAVSATVQIFLLVGHIFYYSYVQ